MHNSVTLAVIALLGFGLDGSLAQEVVKKLGNIRTIFWRSLLLSVVLGSIAALKHDQLTTGPLLIGMVIALAGYLPIWAFYKALNTGKLGIVFPVANSSGFVSVVLAAAFLGERLQGLSYLAIGMVIVGNVGLVIDFKRIHERKLVANTGSLYAAAACIGWGTVFFLYKFPTDALGPTTSAFLIELGVFLAAGLHLLFNKTKRADGELQAQLPRLLAMVLSAAIGVSFFVVALQKGPVSVVNSLVLASGGVGVIYGRIVQKESLSYSQYLAAALVIGGVVLLGGIA